MLEGTKEGLLPLGRSAGTTADGGVAGGELAARPLGVYVHFPFCSVLCPYCDFAVDTRREIPHDAYADAVVSELGGRAPWFRTAAATAVAAAGPAAEAPLVSVYFGGGTPGLWRVDALTRVLVAARQLFTPAAGGASAGVDLEVTLEANPGDLVEGEGGGGDAAAGRHLAELRRAGVNRLSLGVQSFDDRLLAAIGRNHDAAAARRALRLARQAGFDNISLDLMFGLPGQSDEDWRRTLAEAVAFAPEHVSAYALTIERATAFGALSRAGSLSLPESELVADMHIVGRELLAEAGLAQYEVSSYARPGRRAVHNGLYWSGGAYLGVGASASSFRPLADGRGWRFTNPRATETYLRGVGRGARPAHSELRSRADLEKEALWLALRTSEGVHRSRHAARFGVDPLRTSPAREAAARHCQERGWLHIDDERVRPTPAGLLFADEMAARLWD